MVLVQTRVAVMNEAPASGSGDPETLGSFTDSLCLRIMSLDSLLPGSGFAILSHTFRWHRPIALAAAPLKKGLLGARQQCRVQ